MDDDRRTWDDRYADQLAPPPMPPVGLVPLLDRLPSGGSALDLACGLGSSAVWAARQGFETLGVDVSPVAVQRARALAEQHGVGARARFEIHDLDAGLPPMADGPYDLIICQRFRNPDLYPLMVRQLSDGGLLVVTVLSVVGHEGRPGKFHAAEGELLEAFASLNVLYAVEGGGEATVAARRRPGRARAQL